MWKVNQVNKPLFKYWILFLNSSSLFFLFRIWNIKSGECLKVLEGHSNDVFSIKKLCDDRLVSSSYDKTVKLWDLNTGECLRTFIGHESILYSLDVIHQERIVTCSHDKTVKGFWNKFIYIPASLPPISFETVHIWFIEQCSSRRYNNNYFNWLILD